MPPFRYKDFRPARNFSCSNGNKQTVCEALGELFTNDWGMNPYHPCLAGWWEGPNGETVDYDNEDLAHTIDEWVPVTTDSSFNHSNDYDVGHFSENPPRGWTAAAVGVETDYCTFYGVTCTAEGEVSELYVTCCIYV